MRLQKATTCTYPIPDDPDKGEVTIKHLKPGEIGDIEEELGTLDLHLRESEDGALKREGTFNQPKGEKRYIWIIKSVVGWKNILDADGKQIPCTDENKVLVAREDEGFAKFVGECREKLAAQVKGQKEKAEKNS